MGNEFFSNGEKNTGVGHIPDVREMGFGDNKRVTDYLRMNIQESKTIAVFIDFKTGNLT